MNKSILNGTLDVLNTPLAHPVYTAELLRRWQGKVPDEKEVKRTVDALIRRGHSWRDIQSGLRRYRVGLELEEITEDDIS